jgi:hypothetical protein
LAFSSWTIKPWFHTEGKLVAVLITPSLRVSNWTVIYIINTVPPMMHRCVLCAGQRLLQWLNLFFFVFRFFLLLVALIAIVRHNDTQKAYFCLHLMVLARRVLRLFDYPQLLS